MTLLTCEELITLVLYIQMEVFISNWFKIGGYIMVPR